LGNNEFRALSGALNNPARLSKEGRAAASTFDAVLYALRNGGKAALSQQAERLQQFSDQQIEDLIRRLQKAGASEQLLRELAELLP
jgi:hypothetical protein